MMEKYGQEFDSQRPTKKARDKEIIGSSRLVSILIQFGGLKL